MTRPADLLVVGAGPTGLTLALQAHDHGAHVRIVDRRPEPFRPSRALIMHPRTLEVLRPHGVTDAILAHADTAPQARLHLGSRVVPVRLDELAIADTAFPHLTLVRQMDIESILAGALAARGVDIERGVEVTTVESHGDRASATLRTPAGVETSEHDTIAGCDGPESTIRACAGIDWRGSPYAEEVVLADVALEATAREATLEAGVAHVVAGRRGLVFLFALGEQAPWRLLATRPAGADDLPFGRPGPAVDSETLQALLDDAGLPARIATVAWSARYRLQHRLAARFRHGRLFLAGDAAHAWSPAAGQGMNAGIQDATNLGWKLAFSATAADPDTLLASYERERRPTDRRVMAITHQTFWAEASTGLLPAFLRGVVAPLAAPLLPTLVSRRRLVATVLRLVSQLDVAYPTGPLAQEGTPPMRGSRATRPGHRLPDATVTCNGHETRLHALLARPGVHVLLQRDAPWPPDADCGPLVSIHRLDSVPGTGLIAVRPDGVVGFRAGQADPDQLRAWLVRIGAAGHGQRRAAGPPFRIIRIC
jgi:2-polyprenyl-6-methoxyphenol hydroxylase-like FAD-dependent oxidoreductase